MTNLKSLESHEEADRGEGERQSHVQPRDVHCSEDSRECQFDGTNRNQEDPAVEAEIMKNEFKEAELSASARDPEDEELPAIHETTFLNGESVRIDSGSRAVKLWTSFRVKHLWW